MKLRLLALIPAGFLIAFVGLTACAKSAAHHTYSVPRQAIMLQKRRDPELSAAQRNVVLAVVHFVERHPEDGYNARMDPRDVFYALPMGILVVYYGDHRSPEGDEQADWVIGSENLMYRPAPNGGTGPYEGVRFSATIGLKLTPLDTAARNAFKANHVRPVWELRLDEWARMSNT